MGEALAALKALVRDNITLNDGKQQVLGLTMAARKAWEDTGSTAVATAKDRGGA